MPLSEKELKRIAKLAKLEIKEEEKEKFVHQISDILRFISELETVDVSGKSAVGQINDEENNWRDDRVELCSKETRKALLDAAPERGDGFIKVPGVFEDM